jgi:hypothetical protein
MPSRHDRGQQWPTGANDTCIQPLYSPPGIIQTSRPAEQIDDSKKTAS